jgi:rhodanese-related sulfurtransferase
MNEIPVRSARELIHRDTEFALLDVREAGQFIEAHALFAVPVAYSVLERRISALVPRLDTLILLVDAGDRVAARAAMRLIALGYTDVQVVAGGMPAWEEAGFPVYKGVNVPSKTLGELVEALWCPLQIHADELARHMAGKNPPHFYDARPPAEYAKMRVPGAACVPNGELAHRIDALSDGGDAPIVITCAGRTRGITGAIGLSLAGYTGQVQALHNGTQGWALSGRTLERDNTANELPALSASQLASSGRRADALMARFALASASSHEAISMLASSERTTYLFDVRSAPEVRDDPVLLAQAAPAGQLVQATDQWIGVRHARVLLCCDTGLRSALSAFWLTQLGYEAIVVRIDDELRQCEAGESDSAERRAEAALSATLSSSQIIDWISVDEVMTSGDTVQLIDVRSSSSFRCSHVNGAIWSICPRLPAILAQLDRAAMPVLIGDDIPAMALCVQDIQDLAQRRVRCVQGGHEALAAAGAALLSTADTPTNAQAIDFAFFVHDRHDGNLDASRAYLAWETGLVEQLDALERDAFRLFAPSPGSDVTASSQRVDGVDDVER